MDFKKEFYRIMGEQTDLALATSVDNRPNVRIINFVYNNERDGLIYFSSFKRNTKTNEFSLNNKVAFTTIPTDSTEHIRVNNALVSKSHLSVYDLKKEFIGKIPSYEMLIDEAGDQLDIYEIRFKDATVTLNFNEIEHINL